MSNPASILQSKAMLPVTAVERKRKIRGILKPACLFASLVPAALLGFGTISLLLAHKSLTGEITAQQNLALHLFASSRNDADQTRSENGDYFVQHPPDAFQEAWYLDDEPDHEATSRIYEDSHILKLMSNQSYVPFNIFRGENGTNVLEGAGQVHKVLTALRDVAPIAEFFNPVCNLYRFPNISVFPTMSVIVPMQNERSGLLALTVHSLLARTPPEILHEIIIIDDNGDLPSEREDLDEEEITTICSFHPKVKCIHNEQKQGCAGSRLQGIRMATGEVVMIIDSHVEMYGSTWAQHLLLPILENPRTVSMQTLDSLEDLPGHARRKAGSSQNYGVINERFLFAYEADRFKETGRGVERPPTRLPFETPFAPGSLFAIRRDEFWRLGGYDEGLAVWGGENTELAFKVWMCGYDGKGPPGRIVVVPCSRVGHVYRVNIKETGRWPPPLPPYVMERYNLLHAKGKFTFMAGRADNFTKLVVRNNMRILHVWAGEKSNATLGYYNTGFHVNSTDPMALPQGWRELALEMRNDSNIEKQLRIKKQNKCKSFEWFDRHIMFKLVGRHHPWHKKLSGKLEHKPDSVACGGHRADTCGQCPQGHGKTWCNGDCHWCDHGAVGKHNGQMTERTQCVPVESKCYIPSLDPLKRTSAHN